MRSKRWVLCVVVGILMAGPLGRWGTPQEASPDQSGKSSATVATKPLTLEEVNARLDRALGLGRMEVATMQKLVTWYQVDRDHPDAQQLQQEWCGNRRVVREAEVQVIFDKTAFLAAQKSASPEDLQETDDKVVELTGLTRKSTTLFRQLTAMGCVCPAEEPATGGEASAHAGAEAAAAAPVEQTASAAHAPAADAGPNLLQLLDAQRKSVFMSKEALEPAGGCCRLIGTTPG